MANATIKCNKAMRTDPFDDCIRSSVVYANGTMIDYPIRNPENACNSYINDSEFYSNCLCSKNYHVLNCYNSYCENDTMIEVYKQKVIGCKIPTTSTQVPTASPSTTLNPSYESNPFNIFDYSIGIGLLAVLLIILISMLVFRKSLMKRKASANQERRSFEMNPLPSNTIVVVPNTQ